MTAPDRGAVLVTGTSAGIGRAIALELDRAGYAVFAGVRKASDGDALRREASPLLKPVIVDVTKPDQIAALIATLEAELGPDRGLAALVNNAGIAVAGPLEFLSVDDIRRTFEVNVIGQIAVIKACLPLIRKGRGRIIQVSSGARNIAMPFLGAYCSSKAALGIAVTTFRRELRSWKIPVVEVLPGFVLTPMWDKYRAPADAMQSEMPDYAHGQSDAFAKGRGLFEFMARHGKTAEAVARVARRALEARRPRLCYPVGYDSRLGLLSPRLVPPRILDWFIGLVLK